MHLQSMLVKFMIKNIMRLSSSLFSTIYTKNGWLFTEFMNMPAIKVSYELSYTICIILLIWVSIRIYFC